MANTLAELVAEIGRQEGWTPAARGRDFEFVVPTTHGRTQTVRLQAFDHQSELLVRITTTVGPRGELTAERIGKALEVNAHVPYGHLALDGENLVITGTRPIRTTTAVTSGEVIKFIAKQADLYERVIYKQDAH